jgi:NitT/TauT family transport system ATP-binding protein
MASAVSSMPKIRFERVTKSFPDRSSKSGADEVVALSRVDLAVAPGEFMVLVGPSGCGKSTLLDLLSGLAEPSSGTISVDGKAISGPGPDRGIVFQQYALFPWRTALGNVEFGLEAVGLPRAKRAERARHFLALVGLSGFEHHYPHQLSGGMKQRVAIARSLSYDPDILLMDEPLQRSTRRPGKACRTNCCGSGSRPRRRSCSSPTVSMKPSISASGLL